MNVLVTGGAGFIGSHLVEALVDRGDRVVVLDNFDSFYDPEQKRRNLTAAQASGALLVEGDIRSAADVTRAFDALPDVESVVHLAARAGVRPSIKDPLLYSQVNVDGTTVLLEHARQRGVRRFVFASSSSVYGARRDPPFREDDRVDRPVSPYAATKLAGEALCATFSHLYPMQSMALRFFTVFGPRQRPDLAIARFVELLEAGRPLPFFGDGRTSRDYTFVEDIVRGIVAAIDREWPAFEVVNLGGSNPVTLLELVRAIEQAVGRTAELDRLPEQPGDVPLTFASIEKAKRLLGWAPQTPLDTGLRRYIAWLHEARRAEGGPTG